jgi:hypothetical protein
MAFEPIERTRARTRAEWPSAATGARRVSGLVVSLVLALGLAASASAHRSLASRVAAAAPRCPGRLGPARAPRRACLRTHAGATAHSRSLRARAAVVGGHKILIEEAPWQVAVVALDAVGASKVPVLCGGAIIGEREILTAAECVYNFEADPEHPSAVPAEDIFVAPGLSEFKATETEAKGVHVSEVRVHPYYEVNAVNASPDDLAILKLATPLTVGSKIQAIGLVSSGALLPEGTAVSFAGYGKESFGTEPSGDLNSIGMTLMFPRKCGGENDALFLCASGPGGSVCFNDIGSGLELPGSPASLAGIADYTQEQVGGPCQNGAIGFFANLAAPEISQWIAGNPLPPHAPRGGGAVISGKTVVGSSLTCSPGSWLYNPAITISFVNGPSGQVLQQGPSSTYALSAADVGRAILCEVRASNEGGTAFGRTGALGPVKAPAGGSGPAAPAASSTATGSGPTGNNTLAGIASFAHVAKVKGKTATVTVRCSGTVECEGSLRLVARVSARNRGHHGRHRARNVVVGVAAGFFVPAGGAETLHIHLNSEGQKLVRRAGPSGLKVRLEGTGITTGSVVLKEVHPG